MQIQRSTLATLALVLAGTAVLNGCGRPQAAAAVPVSLPQVGVIEVQPQPFALTTELPGRTAPYLIAEVRPQVSGIVKQRAFNEGSEVKAGKVLYEIDPATYQAALDSARAALARAEANAHVARLKAQRYAELAKLNAVSKQAQDDTAAALLQAEADVAAAKAAVTRARIDVDYTRVKAPIAGRIGRSTVTAGALVTANQEQALATVQQLDPIYVDLTQSSADLLRLKRALADGSLQQADGASAPVRLLLEDGTPYAQQGRLAFSEVSVDQATGSVTLRAVFPNPNQQLLPGMYVRAVLEQGVVGNAIALPHQALSRDAKGNATAMMVNADNRIEVRPLKAQRALGDRWLITEGLAAGDRVVVDGLQKIRPGVEVVAVATAPQADAPPAGAH